MAEYLRVHDGVAVEIWAAPEGLGPADCFPAGLAESFRPRGEADLGWVWAGGAFAQKPAPSVDLLAHAVLVQGRMLRAGIEVNVAPVGAAAKPILCDGLPDTRADLALLALFGQANPAGTQTWIDNEGAESVLTGTELVALATLVGIWIAGTYRSLAGVRAAITARTPTITTADQVEAAFTAAA